MLEFYGLISECEESLKEGEKDEKGSHWKVVTFDLLLKCCFRGRSRFLLNLAWIVEKEGFVYSNSKLCDKHLFKTFSTNKKQS